MAILAMLLVEETRFITGAALLSAIAYNLIAAKDKEPFRVLSPLSSSNSVDTGHSIISLALADPAMLSLSEKMLRLSSLMHLASPASGADHEILYPLNCLYEFLPQKIFLYFRKEGSELVFVGGIRPGKKKEIEKIARADMLVDETLQRIKSFAEVKNFKKLCLNEEIQPVSLESSSPETFMVPLSLFGGFEGLLVAISLDKSGFSKHELSLMTFFSEQMALYLDDQRRLATQRQNTSTDSENQLCDEIVRGFLPESTPVLPGWDLTFSHFRAAEYAGDYFDFIQMPGGALMVVIGKASGKGLNAAMFFTRLQAMVRCLSGQFKTPADILNQLAQLLGGDTNQELFATLLALMLKPGSHEVIFAGAGHAAPIINRTRNGYVEIAGGESGIPLGLFSNSPNIYQNQTIQMLPGDGLFIYTDGILENHQQNGKQISVEKLKLKLEQLPEQSAAQMLEQFISEIISESGVSKNLPEDQTGLYLKVE